MVDIAYAATLPVLQREFVSLRLPGAGAVASVVLLRRMPEASALHGGRVMRRAAVSAPTR